MQPDANYGPILIIAVAVLLGALLLGIAVYIRGSAQRASPILGILYSILIVSPVVAATAYYAYGLTRDLSQPSPHFYSSEGSPRAVQTGAVPVR